MSEDESQSKGQEAPNGGKGSRKKARSDQPKSRRVAKAGQSQERPETHFPVVAIGASAGGLQALEEFFRHVRGDSGMAFIVLTHRTPDHESLLSDLLAKHTPMQILNAGDGVRLSPNKVYVLPARRIYTLREGVFKEGPPVKEAGQRVHLPIDRFFRSLAEDFQERAAAVILSGTGSDGTLGARTIKEHAGFVIAQDPESAEQGSMPASAIASGEVDQVLTPENMGKALVDYMKAPPLLPAEIEAPMEGVIEDAMTRITRALRRRTDHDFSVYKEGTLRRRTERRMNVHHMDAPMKYADYLESNPQEVDLLFREVLIGATNFFRDPEAYQVLAEDALKPMLASYEDDYDFRVWTPGCSTGEEPYSLAMLLVELLDELDVHPNVQIFATDIDVEAIDRARAGHYPEGIVNDLSPGRLKRFFHPQNSGYMVNKSIRDMVVFAVQDILKDPPFTRLDLVSCRNVLIYLKNEAQERLVPLFHYSLKPGGILWLGGAESIGRHDELFDAVDKRWRVYKKKETKYAHHPPLTFPASAGRSWDTSRYSGVNQYAMKDTSVLREVEKVLLRHFAPSCAVVNRRGDILYIHGRTGRYLEPAEGASRYNVLDMAREGLRTALNACLHDASVEEKPVVRTAVRVKTNGGYELTDVSAIKLNEPESIRGLLLVTFRPSPSAPQPREIESRKDGETVEKTGEARVQELELELDRTRQTLQSTVEQLESSNEELRSMNEELESTNEELQSTNEELETSKEESQSLNEELTTVNAELNSKVHQLTRARDDMEHLLNNTGIATLFLDNNLCVKRFTEEIERYWKLIPTDVGRPIGDVTSYLEYEHFEKDARHALKSLECIEKEVQSKKGAWVLVNISPYRTSENIIDGLVVTFFDITRFKSEQFQREEALSFSNGIVETIRQPILVLDDDFRVVAANRVFYETFEVNEVQTIGQLVYDLGNGQWDIPDLRNLLERILPENSVVENYYVTHEFPKIGRRTLLLNGRQLTIADKRPEFILLVITDITESKPDQEP